MGVRILTQEMERICTDTLHFLFSAPIKREGVVRVGQCPRFPLSPIDTAPDSGYTEFQRGDSIMKDTILSVIRLIATPVLLMVLGLILLIHPDSASALVAQILGWVLVIAGVMFAVSAIAGHFDTVGKVLSAVCCFAVGAWLLRNPLMLAAGLGRLAGILLVVRGIQDILNASRYHYGILPAVITTILGAVLIALPMTTSRVVISLCGLLVLIVGMRANDDNAALAEGAGLRRAPSGFMAPRDMFLGNVKSNIDGIFYAGTVTAPKNIGESLNEGIAAADAAAKYVEA